MVVKKSWLAERKQKIITWATIISFLSVCLFMGLREREAEASAVTVAGWIGASSKIGGAYLSSKGKIYITAGEVMPPANRSQLLEIDPYHTPLPLPVETNEATFVVGTFVVDCPLYTACGVINNNIYFIGGGQESSGEASPEKIWKFTPDSLEIVGTLPQPRMQAAFATFNGSIYLAGGREAYSRSSNHLSDIIKYDGQTVQAVGALPIPLYDAAAEFASDGKMIIFGGTTPELVGGEIQPRSLDSIYQFDPVAGETSQIGTLPYACGGLRAARVGDVIYVFMPEENSSGNKTEIYEFKNGQLSKLSVTVPERLVYTCPITVGNKIYIFGGYIQGVGRSNKIWVLNTDLIPPDKISVDITRQDNTVILDWDPDAHAQKYHIEHSRDGINWTEIGVTTGDSYTHNPTDPGKHYYRVRGESEGGAYGEYSDPVMTIIHPQSPTGLQAAVDGRIVDLTWSSVYGASKYIVQRSLDGENWSQIAETTETAYRDSNTNWDTTYHYRVLSKTEDEVLSEPSNSVQVTTDNLPAPTGLRVSLNGTKITLTWQPSAEATAYIVERSLDGRTWTSIATVTQTHLDTNTVPNTVYYYRVRAKKNNTISDPSEVKSVRTGEDPAPPPQVVSGLTAVWNGDYIKVTWIRGQSSVPDGVLELWRQMENGPWLPVKSVSASERDSFAFNDINVAVGLNCRYELRYQGGWMEGFKWHKVSESGWSTGERPLPAPGGIQVTLNDSSAIISWEPVTGAGSYAVQYSTNQGGSWQTKTVSGTSTTVTRKSLVRVRAGGSQSQWSGTVTVD